MIGYRKSDSEWMKEIDDAQAGRATCLFIKHKGLSTAIMKCNSCGNIWESSCGHLAGTRGGKIHSCKKCSLSKLWNNSRLSLQKAKNKVENETKGQYTILTGDYKNAKSKLMFLYIPLNIKFEMSYNQFQHGKECPYLGYSANERVVLNILKDNKINFISQWRYKTENHDHYFDFFLPEYKIAIEIQGQQHYQPVCFGGISKKDAISQFNHRKILDKDKKSICCKEKIRLVCIKYTAFTSVKKAICILSNELNKKLKYSSNINYYMKYYPVDKIISDCLKFDKKYVERKYLISGQKLSHIVYEHTGKHLRHMTEDFNNKDILQYFSSHTVQQTCAKYNCSSSYLLKIRKSCNFGKINKVNFLSSVEKERRAKLFLVYSKKDIPKNIYNSCKYCFKKQYGKDKTTYIKEKSSQFYLNHTLEETCYKFNICNKVVQRHFRKYFGMSKTKYLKLHPELVK